MSLSAAALITYEEAEKFLQKQNVSVETFILEAVIEGVSALFSDMVDCDFNSATYTAEAIDGSGTPWLYLPHWPVTVFTTCVEDGATLTKDTDFYVDYDLGIMDKPKYGWPTANYQSRWTTSKAGVVNTYTAGYAAVPADVKLACLMEVGRLYEIAQKKMFGESTRSLEGVSVTINTDELMPSTLSTLGRYVRVRI